MPVIYPCSYSPPPMFRNAHVQTIFASRFRGVGGVRYERERIPTPDGDFLDLDWSRVGRQRLAVLSHGLEGSSTRTYMLGMARAFNRRGWDVLAWNFRGCGGEVNRTLRFYHSGETGDLETVIRHATETCGFRSVVLVGFSAGGNMVLKYLGERGEAVPSEIKGGVAFSVPCDLASSARRLAEPSNRLYLKRFLRMLRAKIVMKMETMPGLIDDVGYERIKTFREFDDRYTAPVHGFNDAEDYWARASSRPFLPKIRVPTLLVDSLDDPFLGPACFPLEEASGNPRLLLEVAEYGGHVGFIRFGNNGEYWSETRAVTFAGDLPYS